MGRSYSNCLCFNLFAYYSFFVLNCTLLIISDKKLYNLVPDMEFIIKSSNKADLKTFCYHGEKRYPSTLFKTVEVSYV